LSESGSLSFSGFFSEKSACPAGVSKRTSMSPLREEEARLRAERRDERT
jgi:hypothetical protein